LKERSQALQGRKMALYTMPDSSIWRAKATGIEQLTVKRLRGDYGAGPARKSARNKLPYLCESICVAAGRA
jgi:hypothetical protein